MKFMQSTSLATVTGHEHWYRHLFVEHSILLLSTSDLRRRHCRRRHHSRCFVWYCRYIIWYFFNCYQIRNHKWGNGKLNLPSFWFNEIVYCFFSFIHFVFWFGLFFYFIVRDIISRIKFPTGFSSAVTSITRFCNFLNKMIHFFFEFVHMTTTYISKILFLHFNTPSHQVHTLFTFTLASVSHLSCCYSKLKSTFWEIVSSQHSYVPERFDFPSKIDALANKQR